MPKPATGEIRWVDGVAIARVTLSGRARATLPMPAVRTNDEAKDRARVLAALAKRLREARVTESSTREALRLVAAASSRALPHVMTGVAEELLNGAPQPGSAQPTVKQVGEQWTTGGLARRYPDQVRVKRSVDDDVTRFTKYIYPLIGDLQVDQVTLDDCERVMMSLPTELATMTRRNVGQLLVRLLNMAVYPMRIIARSPIPKGFLPALPKRKAYAHLYPSEDARLLACVSIPIQYRILWGFLDREGMRLGEAQALMWRDLDLERGAVRLDKNKTDDPRAWALRRDVAAALRLYKEQFVARAAEDSLVFERPCGRSLSEGGNLANILREHLRAIGLHEERPELFETTKQRHQMRVHDLRGTFVTINLANGKSESWIQDRTGHQSSVMIARYKRTARTFAELGAGELGPLDRAVPELADCPRLPTEPPISAKSLKAGSGLYSSDPQRQTTGTIENPQESQGPGERSSAIEQPGGESMGNASHLDVVLADALVRATAAGQWTVVEALAAELKARREAVAGVVRLDAERKRRGR